ncbi:NAD(P)-dependent oxidoreductase [Streptomyces sp. SBT349]|uniref:NAD(P)-dependent oxidoreductase n=1 Tax=Streptomyces sp. SBT349 TaxID=1580539 RepID=UPI00066DDBBA|nr:NAD(P)-dependent oxidoreductase [Streptomyces sp. SBT349]
MSATTATPERIGFIGLGDQGGPMARAIAEAGHPLHAWARRPASLAILDGVPYTAHAGAADLAAACDILCLCLPEDEDVRSVVLDGGLLEHMKPGSVLVNHGTGLPAFAGELTRLCAAHDVHVLDAAVSGARAGALAKTLTTMVGGDETQAKRCEGIFQSFSTSVVYMGGAGSGQLAKLFNNALMMMNQRSIEEIIEVAQRVHLDLPRLLEVLGTGSATSAALTSLNAAITVDNAEHLTKLQLIDMQLFADAVAPHHAQADDVTARAVDGSHGLVALARAVAPH